jgi:transcriptional repressor NrdR
MKCPFCGHLEDKVIDSRSVGTGEVIRRRRECESCSRRFTTYERVEDVLPTVVKKDGRREPFDRQKLVRGLRTACSKRPVSVERIEAIADAIEREAQEAEKREVTSSELGERVMVHLRDVDEVAYVRFASVYRSFRDVDEFLRELGKLVKERGGAPA